ncbi:MAG: hypothetical protein HZB46_00130 [Solirubrobacterales bacterium]|nr:hypothetical protein [Solirubrobacterales bacterium]
MSDQQRQPTEEELRAYAQQMEAQLKQLRVEDVVAQTIVTLVNVGGRKAGLAPGTEDERDPEQLRMAIEGARALLPLVEDLLGPDAKAIRDALSQLQMAYAQGAQGGAAPAPEPGGQAPAQDEKPSGAGPAQSSGRLWVPGQ